MASKTNVSWADSSSNAILGCSRISEGCKNCFAAVDTPARVLRHRGIETWGDSGQRVPVKGFEKSMLAMNRKPEICDHCGTPSSVDDVMSNTVSCQNRDCPANLSEQVQSSFHTRRIFCDSNSDWLDDKWPIETLAHFLDVLRRCSDVTLINCTKRPENFEPRFTAVMKWLENKTPAKKDDTFWNWLMDWHDGKPPSNIIQLTSIENQAMLEKRYRDSVAIPAACRGFSFEPLLSEIIVPDWTGISWAIIGGESGSNARPCNVDWIRSLVEQGKAAGAATFVKQFGANPVSVYKPSDEKDYCTITMNHRDKKGGDIAEFPKDLQVREWPKGF